MELRSDEMRQTLDELLTFESYPGAEKPAQRWLHDRLDALGFETYEWEPDEEVLSNHPSFPPVETLTLKDRPSVAGVIEIGDPTQGPTIVLNGHVDVVPASEGDWESAPFEPRWADGGVYARGAADMKGGLIACIFAALAVREHGTDLDGRIVVESVIGEEEGGIGAATAAANNPYPFDRDAALVAEPSEFEIVIAAGGSLMKRLTIHGRSAHAALRWKGESVLPHFERVRHAFEELERDRAERVTHPLYEQYDTPWPVNFGTVRAGEWASSVPAKLTSEIRIGVAPHETVRAVETEFQQRLDQVVGNDEWLSAHPPGFERFSVQFEGSEVDREQPVVAALAETIKGRGGAPTYTGFTAGTDARHFIDAGIPTVIFGPGSVDIAHQPNEFVEWADVVTSSQVIAKTVERYIQNAPTGR